MNKYKAMVNSGKVNIKTKSERSSKTLIKAYALRHIEYLLETVSRGKLRLHCLYFTYS